MVSEEEYVEPLRWLHLDLLIVHPTLTPSEITWAMGVRPHHAHLVGEPRLTPRGRPLGGTYKDTRWRRCYSYPVRGQWFFHGLTRRVRRLRRHKTFFHRLRETGGSAEIILWLMDEEYYADTLPVQTLTLMADLRLDLGFDCMR